MFRVASIAFLLPAVFGVSLLAADVERPNVIIILADDLGYTDADDHRVARTIPAGATSAEIVTAMDLLPTIGKLTGMKSPERKVDGRDDWAILSGAEGAKSPHHAFFYYADNELHALRCGHWKLHLAHPYLEVDGVPGTDRKPANFVNIKPESIQLSGLKGVASRHGYWIEQMPQSLFDLEKDPGERRDIASEHPDIVQELLQLCMTARATLGDSLTG